jgi:hypothetical protein
MLNRPPRRELMQYVLLIYDDERIWAGMDESQQGSMMKEYFTFTNELRDRGAYVDGNPLQPTETATSVQVRDGERLVTDGPFAETKEQLGGYYIVEADSIDEAIDWAAKIPSARLGTIEVRPILQVPAGAPSS